MVRRKGVLERYAALRCLWHGVHVVERTNRQSPCAAHVARRPVRRPRLCVATLVRVSARRRRGAGLAGAPVRPTLAPG
eukprot:3149469-Prymnesium_polylepis.1